MRARTQEICACIYCGSVTYSKESPARKLGDEHIIPCAIGGDLILREASCQSCETITSGIESKCTQKLFASARPHLNIGARKGKLRREKLPVSAGREGSLTKVLISEHPGTIMMFKLDVASEFLGWASEPAFAGQCVLRPVVPDFKRRVSNVGGLHVQLGGTGATTFGRFLAKIAHSYAVYELQIGGFIPCLTPCIIGRPPYDTDLGRFVGGTLFDEPNGTQRHEIGIVPRQDSSGNDLIVVRIRLFSDQHMPAYYVVAGRPI